MTEHELKTWPEYFEPTWNGLKRFEFRKNDRDFKQGDVLRLREWDPKTEKYTGREIAAMVAYVLYSGFGLPDGTCIMSLAAVRRQL